MSVSPSAVLLRPATARLARFFTHCAEWFQTGLASADGTCPRCHGQFLHRSRTRWYESWRKVFALRPHRCQACYYRVWLRPVDVDKVRSTATAVDLRTFDEPLTLKDMDLTLSDDQPTGLIRPSWTSLHLRETRVDWQVVALVRALEDRLSELGLSTSLKPTEVELARRTTRLLR